MNDKKLSWTEYHRYIDILADKIQQHRNREYKHIFAVDTDGLFVGAHLSHRLHKPLVTDISLLTFMKNIADIQNNVLIVSNIVQTGKTFMNIVNEMACTLDTAALFLDKACDYPVTYYIEKPEDHIIFPWE